MKISVIIPVYNGEKYLAEAVESVLGQPYKNTRVIIVNDGSTDNTLSVCNQLKGKDERITVIDKTNGGVSSARNAGIEYVLSSAETGEYIAFLDADDKWNSNIITEFVIEQHADSDVIAFELVQANEDLSRFSTPTKRKCQQLLTDCRKHIWKFNDSFCCKLFASDIIKNFNIRFDERMSHNEDHVFQMQVISFSKLISTENQTLLLRRNNKQSVSHSKNSLESLYYPMIEGWIRCDDFINNVAIDPENPFIAGTVMAGIYFLDMITLAFRSSFLEGNKIKKSAQMHPNYSLFLEMRKQDVSKTQYSSQQLLLHHPIIFAIKERLFGLAFKCAKKILTIGFISDKYETRKYPYDSSILD